MRRREFITLLGGVVQTRDQDLRRATPCIALVSTAAADARSGNGAKKRFAFLGTPTRPYEERRSLVEGASDTCVAV
jgi:hypothetical protein